MEALKPSLRLLDPMNQSTASKKRCRRRGAITKAKWWQMFGLCLRPSVCMERWSGFWLEDDFLAAVVALMPRQRSWYLTFTCFLNEIRETTRSRSCVRFISMTNLEGIESGQAKIKSHWYPKTSTSYCQTCCFHHVRRLLGFQVLYRSIQSTHAFIERNHLKPTFPGQGVDTN